jgi:hypothetical protein
VRHAASLPDAPQAADAQPEATPQPDISGSQAEPDMDALIDSITIDDVRKPGQYFIRSEGHDYPPETSGISLRKSQRFTRKMCSHFSESTLAA